MPETSKVTLPTGRLACKNKVFRKALWTGEKSQLALMMVL